MPFIKQIRRDWYNEAALSLLCDVVRACSDPGDDNNDGPLLCAGDLAYIVYRILLAAAPEDSQFDQRNSMMAAVDEARLTYRRLVHDPAEDRARAENGDI